jgi:hypothetical protein
MPLPLRPRKRDTCMHYHPRSTLMPVCRCLLVIALLLAGCRDFSLDADGDPRTPHGSETLVASLNVPFEIGFGQEVILDDTGLRVEFSLLTEDSRCTLQVQCVQAGRAGVILTVHDQQEVRYQLVAFIPGLVATPYRVNDIIQFHDLRFRLLRVNPYPEEGRPVRESEYSVLLEVEPNGF